MVEWTKHKAEDLKGPAGLGSNPKVLRKINLLVTKYADKDVTSNASDVTLLCIENSAYIFPPF